jgi:uncharacterized repeat protein (TIGR01451 family)
LPSGFTAGTPSQGTYNSATGVWTITSLANDNSATLVFTGPLTAGEAGTTIVNGATETQNEYPLTVTVPSASIYVNKAVVSVTNVANPSTGNVGNTGTFTLTATNNGPDSATNVVITDPLPSGFTAGTPSQGTYDAATGVWNIGTLANSASVTLTFTGTLAANQAGTTIINSATESQDEYPPVTIPNASIYVNEANVTLSQTGGYSGSVVTFIVTASNQGPDSASNMRITDVMVVFGLYLV